MRSSLHRKGLRFRKDYSIRTRTLRVRPDVVFPRLRLAVFIDGCFWHGCPEHGNLPSTNEAYWGPKLARNQQRDTQVTQALKAEGWTVMRVWEHEPPQLVAERIQARVRLLKGACQL